MPVLDADAQAGQAVTTTAETVIATVSGVNTRFGGSVILQGAVAVTTGAGATAIQLRVRRGTTTAGAQVGQTYNLQTGASLPAEAEIQVQDNPGEVAGASYVLTLQQTAATGNATVNEGNLRAEF